MSWGNKLHRDRTASLLSSQGVPPANFTADREAELPLGRTVNDLLVPRTANPFTRNPDYRTQYTRETAPQTSAIEFLQRGGIVDRTKKRPCHCIAEPCDCDGGAIKPGALAVSGPRSAAAVALKASGYDPVLAARDPAAPGHPPNPSKTKWIFGGVLAVVVLALVVGGGAK